MNEKTERETGSARATAHRAIRDVPSLQALAHPTRLALLEAIGLAGAMTATQASEVVGESPTACAYHLRMLARLGFVEEAGGGQGRQRPWRLVPTGFTVGEDPDDPASANASAALEKILLERFFSNIRRFGLERSRYAQQVQDVTETIQSIAFATPEEMTQLREELIALLSRYVDRLDPELRPAGGYPFELIVFTHVLHVPGLTPGAPDAQPPPQP
ncbi:MAG: helix-turn-helix domain-containing protein [Trebonia sp.]|jgi:DNA-binding transcriptional ArsR family regulator